MTLKRYTIIRKEKRADTMYISIPSKMATDSQFPFKKGDRVEIIVYPERKLMEIRAIDKEREKGA